MGFLTRLLKTPDEDQEEGPDELDAEEKGLLMVPSLPGEERPEPEGEPDARGTDVQGELVGPPAQGADLVEAATPPLLSDGGESPEPARDSLPIQDATNEPASAEAPAEQASSDDAMDMFRADTERKDLLPSGLTDGLVEVSAADLLAEARSLRNSILDGQAAGRGEP